MENPIDVHCIPTAGRDLRRSAGVVFLLAIVIGFSSRELRRV
jgi:hypothetical protein